MGATMPSLASAIKLTSLKAFEMCAQDYGNEACLFGLDAYLAKQPSKALEAGKIVRRHYLAAKALPYFALAGKKMPSAALCADADVQSALESALYLPGDYDNAKLAQQLFEGVCFSSMLGTVQKQLTEEGSTHYLKANVCPVLARKNAPAPSCSAKVAELPK